MRDERIKFDRYQKQFRFLYSHGIETAEHRQAYQAAQEQQIENLTKKLYNERNNTDEQVAQL